MDREKIIQQIAAAMVTLEECTDQEVGDTKKFLRWSAALGDGGGARSILRFGGLQGPLILARSRT